jgi:hypothetical protein
MYTFLVIFVAVMGILLLADIPPMKPGMNLALVSFKMAAVASAISLVLTFAGKFILGAIDESARRKSKGQ